MAVDVKQKCKLKTDIKCFSEGQTYILLFGEPDNVEVTTIDAIGIRSLTTS